MRDHQKLRVWQASYQLALDIYEATSTFPNSEMYGLTSQLRRAAVSVGSNITEGAARASRAEFARFLEVALASASECSFHLQLASDLSYIGTDESLRLQSAATGLRRQLATVRASVLKNDD